MGSNFRTAFKTGLLLATTLSPLGFAAGKGKATNGAQEEERCMSSLLTGSTRFSNPETLARLESYTLAEILEKPEFWRDHPSTVMNAHQNLLAWTTHVPTTSIHSVESRRHVEHFPVFSRLNELNERRAIIGHESEIEALVDNIREGAAQTKSSQIPMLLGPAGTGKSEFLTISQIVGTNLTLSNPLYQQYTFEFHDLDKIPDLRDIFGIIDEEGSFKFRSPTDESPFVLLSKEMQEQVKSIAAPSVQSLIGMDPNPRLTRPNSQTAFVRDAIIAHYVESENIDIKDAKQFNEAKVIELLSRHVTVVRRVLTHENFPKLGAQGKDVPYNQIFYSTNAIIENLKGPGHPFAVHLNGLLMRANGTVLGLDEFYRNEEPLLDAFLDVLESHRVARGGGPTVPLDVVFIAASNNESLEKIAGEGSGKALRDRSQEIEFFHSTRPFNITATTLLMRGESSVEMRRLSTPDQIKAAKNGDDSFTPTEWQELDINEVYPEGSRGDVQLGESGRFALRLKPVTSSSEIFIAPHTLLFMSSIVAASRMETDRQKAMKRAGGADVRVIGSAYFTDPVARVNLYLGDHLGNVGETERQALKKITTLLDEGRNGISQRDAAKWFKRCIAEARKKGNQNTITPQLALKVFEALLDTGDIKHESEKDRIKWLYLAVSVGEKVLLPRINNDVAKAVGYSEGSVQAVYDKVIAMLNALGLDKSANQYRDSEQVLHTLDKDLLNAIAREYFAVTGRRLVPEEISNFYFANREATRSGENYKELELAIHNHLANKVKDVASLDAMARYGRTGEGNADVAAKFTEIGEVMINHLGYNEASMLSALEFADQVRARAEQLRASLENAQP